MSVVMDLGLSQNWQTVDLSTIVTPAELLVCGCISGRGRRTSSIVQNVQPGEVTTVHVKVSVLPHSDELEA